MATHHDSHANADDKGGIWKGINFIIGVGFAVFSLVAGTALIYGGLVIRSGGDTAPKKVAAAPVPPAPAAATAPAAPAAGAPAAEAPAPAAAGSVAEVIIKPDTVNPLMFDTKSFTVKAGQSVKLTFENKAPVPQPHNWVLGKMGTKDALIAAANGMMTNPEAPAKGYIPEIPEVLAHTKLLNPGETGVVEFTAPAEAGEYPYICSFPGHSIMMNGVMKVE